MASGFGRAATTLGGLLQQFALQKHREQEIATERAREDSWKQRDLELREDDLLTRLQLDYGWRPGAPASTPVSPAPVGSGGAALSTSGASPLTASPGRLLQTAALGGAAGDAPEATGGPVPPTSAPPVAPNTITVRGRSGTIDPSRSVAGMQSAAERQRVRNAALPALRAVYGDQAEAMADALANGITPQSIAYQPLTRDQQFADLRQTSNIQADSQVGVWNRTTGTRPDPGSLPQLVQGTDGQYMWATPGSREIQPATLPDGTPFRGAGAENQQALGNAITWLRNGISPTQATQFVASTHGLKPGDASVIVEKARGQVAQNDARVDDPNASRQQRIGDMRRLIQVQSPQAQLAFLYAFQKFQDDGGVVRGDDIDVLRSAASLAQRMEAAQNKGKGMLVAPSVLEGYLKAAEAMAGASGTGAGGSGMSTNDLLSKYGLTPK